MHVSKSFERWGKLILCASSRHGWMGGLPRTDIMNQPYTHASLVVMLSLMTWTIMYSAHTCTLWANLWEGMRPMTHSYASAWFIQVPTSSNTWCAFLQVTTLCAMPPVVASIAYMMRIFATAKSGDSGGFSLRLTVPKRRSLLFLIASFRSLSFLVS